MIQLAHVIKQMITISDNEMSSLLNQTATKTFKRYDLLSKPGVTPNEIFFINKGIIRLIVTDRDGKEHTTHFALENQFIADYSSFILSRPSIYSLEALEETTVVILPRSCIEWGYQHLNEGQKFGRLIAEFYFIYQDNRISNLYAYSPRERYEAITKVFPNIHNRVPQHMIASYLGITSVHLSRLKKM